MKIMVNAWLSLFLSGRTKNNDYYEYEVYDNVLLQLDSQDDLLMWGDCVLLCFFLILKIVLIENWAQTQIHLYYK